MTYETPTLMFIGAAHGVVRGDLTGGWAGPLSDNMTDPDRGIVIGNSRFRFID